RRCVSRPCRRFSVCGLGASTWRRSLISKHRAGAVPSASKRAKAMTNKKSELHAVEAPEQTPEVVTEEMLDADEAEFARLRRDLPGVKGASAAGIVSIGVGKIPGKNEFFRTHPEFRPTVPMVDVEVGMEK